MDAYADGYTHGHHAGELNQTHMLPFAAFVSWHETKVVKYSA
jgi:hypothetical protein